MEGTGIVPDLMIVSETKLAPCTMHYASKQVIISVNQRENPCLSAKDEEEEEEEDP